MREHGECNFGDELRNLIELIEVLGSFPTERVYWILILFVY